MCCLKNEEEVYEFLNSKLPNIGDTATTPEGWKGEVTAVSVLNQKVKLIVNLEKEDQKELREYKASELKFKPRRRKPEGEEQSSEKKHSGEKNGRKNR